jgi:hypothetical protein
MTTADEELLEPYAVAEIFVDGFTKHTLRDGVMTCVGFRNMTEGKVIVVRLVWPAVNTVAAINDAVVAMENPEPRDMAVAVRKIGRVH